MKDNAMAWVVIWFLGMALICAFGFNDKAEKQAAPVVEVEATKPTKEVLKPSKLVDEPYIEWDDVNRYRIAGRTVIIGLQSDGALIWRVAK